MADVSTVLGKGHSRRDCPAGKRSESRGPQSGSEEPKVAKTAKIRSRSRDRKSGPEKEGGAAQEHPEPTVKINPMKGVHGHYNPCTRGGQQSCGRSDQPFEGSQWTGLEIGGAWWGSSRS